MRITIDIDDRTGAQASLVGSEQPQAMGSEPSPINGGAGPEGDLSSASGSVVQTDGGKPPQWLLDEIAAAQSSGRDTPAGDDDGHATDAGAAPDSP
jgi:hypothetical protein